ncbi:hypothetical protein OKA04_23330 [Luteolibacter flavescens]|uniref:Morphogenetic protein n=1 Tax=Luteolibacter flavescens TaxID=1859460 RepID=A0ABT3FWT8_9BACT|nr:hypothetical protein [Luteolibacter flavescens]MCW1887689.1 hypothetical protein [Luteolibacter flavescens]
MSTSTIKERPILFSGPMVRALLDGTKTQTRRIIAPQPEATSFAYLWKGREIGEKIFPLTCCPYGAPGDRLWVRETFGDRADYAAIGALHKDRYYYAADGKKAGWRYRPSIHMPRKASRITLEVVSVRVERLQDISEEDAIAEGIECTHRDEDRTFWKNYRFEGPIAKRGKVWTPEENQIVNYNRKPVRSYQSLWESINGPGSWDANPWVWVVEFKRLSPTDH